MGVRTTFGMGWWDPDALVKICFQNITLTNILVRLVRVGQPIKKPIRLKRQRALHMRLDGLPACLPARGNERTTCFIQCNLKNKISFSFQCFVHVIQSMNAIHVNGEGKGIT